MSAIKFTEEMSQASKEFMEKFLGKPVAEDKHRQLYNGVIIPQRKFFSEIANLAKQPVTLELYEAGESREMEDGARYEVDSDGKWEKINVTK